LKNFTPAYGGQVAWTNKQIKARGMFFLTKVQKKYPLLFVKDSTENDEQLMIFPKIKGNTEI
jgi:hypothetical protein